MIPYGRQEITELDIAAVREVLESDFLTQGRVLPEFEESVAKVCGADHAVAVNSATSALHISCLALGLGVGDWLWTSPNTFVASANCGLYCGANVDFVDIDPQTYNLSAVELKRKLEQAKAHGRLPKILVVVHLAGQACDMQEIHALSKKYGFRIIEDASHAIGGQYRGEPIGNCRYSDITVFSFHPVKIITTGEGGMALTNDSLLATRLGLFRSHGITRDQDLMTKETDGPWYYQQIELGMNYRMTDIQAALGISQLARLQEYINRRHEIAERYDQLLADLPLTLPWQHPESYSAFHLYIVRLQLDKIKPVSHSLVFEALRAANIMVNLHYIPVHTHPYFKAIGFKDGDFPQAEQYYREAISIPIYPMLTDDQQVFVVNTLRKSLGV